MATGPPTGADGAQTADQPTPPQSENSVTWDGDKMSVVCSLLVLTIDVLCVQVQHLHLRLLPEAGVQRDGQSPKA